MTSSVNLWGEVATLCASMVVVVVMLISATGRSSSNSAEMNEYALEMLARKHGSTNNASCQCPESFEPRISTIGGEDRDFMMKRTDDVAPIRILSWTAMNMQAKDHQEIWFAEKGKPSMDKCYRPDRNYLDPVRYPCIYTNKKSLFNVSDAVLFRGRRMEELPMPHKKRTPDQKWIFWEFEPPYKVWWDANLTNYAGVFNLSATYSRDSDIPNMHYLDNICLRDHQKRWKLRKKDYTWKKTQKVPIVWFASVCKTQSRREKYVKKLQNYIPVDIYGDCGPKKCGSNRQATWTVDKCDNTMFHGNHSYKFYLALENSLCDDYVTEKLWKTIVPPLDAVPIVMGNVDYSNILPADSYIDVRDFDTPKDLADYIHYLDTNDEAYNNYLRNKHSLKCQLVHKYMPWHCRMCQVLHEMKNQRKIIYDLGRFWGSRRCMSPLDFFGNRKEDWDFRQ